MQIYTIVYFAIAPTATVSERRRKVSYNYTVVTNMLFVDSPNYYDIFTNVPKKQFYGRSELPLKLF